MRAALAKEKAPRGEACDMGWAGRVLWYRWHARLGWWPEEEGNGPVGQRKGRMSSVQHAEVESQKDSPAEAAASLEFGRSAILANPEIPSQVAWIDEANFAAATNKAHNAPHEKWLGLLGPV